MALDTKYQDEKRMELMKDFGLATGDQRLIIKFQKTGAVIQVWDGNNFCSIDLAEFQLEDLRKGLKK